LESFIHSFWQGVLATSLLEWVAVLTGILYVIFAAKRMIICWLFAGVSSIIYVYICVFYELYLESILQVFYLIMAYVGWRSWVSMKLRKSIENLDESLLDQNATEANGDIRTWTLSQHVINVLISGGVAFTLGFLFDLYTSQQNPYMDAFTTVFSLAATFMVTRKVLENWLYWIVIDVVSIFLYSYRGLQLSSVLYFVFTILALIGFVTWYKKWKQQSA
jgi:nicotinamide mononucleotide transporter